jgi:hypothetical protein
VSVATLPGPIHVAEDLLPARYAQRLLDHWRAYPGYCLSSDGGTRPGRALACSVAHRPRAAASIAAPPPTSQIPPELVTALPPRFDATANFVRTGGFGRTTGESAAQLQARTNYFRATYVSGRWIYAPVVCGLLNHPVLAETAGRLFGRPLVVPTTVYANVMLPGQELGLHTDVPEFRGANRERFPLWLLVVMQHSELFEPWRIHLATAVLHLGECRAGGEFLYYPAGPAGPCAAIGVRHNAALVLDADSVLHGVGRVGADVAAPTLPGGSTLSQLDRRWRLVDDGRDVGNWSEDEVRYSISWKAQCFADAAERRAVAEHSDDLDYDTIMTRLTRRLPRAIDLCAGALAHALVDAYVQFPT